MAYLSSPPFQQLAWSTRGRPSTCQGEEQKKGFTENLAVSVLLAGGHQRRSCYWSFLSLSIWCPFLGKDGDGGVVRPLVLWHETRITLSRFFYPGGRRRTSAALSLSGDGKKRV